MNVSNVIELRPRNTEHYFGGCPRCGKTDGYMNVGREHWFVCDAHRTKWRAGANLFSCWRDEESSVWSANASKLTAYRCVEPLPMEQEPPMKNIALHDEQPETAWLSEDDIPF